MNKDSNRVGNGMIFVGILLFIIGLVAYFYGKDTVVLGTVVGTTYPHRDFGIIMLIIGSVTAIVGAVMGHSFTR
ncbi:MAG: hypothetical protein ACOC8Y_04830 [Candidatus Natronoplasma sp.]